MAPKRKMSNSTEGKSSPPARGQKKSKAVDLSQPHPNAKSTEEFGIVQREFYPPEMSNERCMAYNDGTLERPIDLLERTCKDTAESRRAAKPGKAVVHWFKTDLRVQDNRGLHAAYELAKEHQIPLIGVYIVSPQDWSAHVTSPARVDFTLRTLHLLQRDLAKLDIPLYIETQEDRKNIPNRIVELCQNWGANHLRANIEYEVDELRREAKVVRLCARSGIDFTPLHDTCVVTPGVLWTGSGKQYAVYTPWFKGWLAYLKENPDLLELSDSPQSNPASARKEFGELFDCKIPAAPQNKTVTQEEAKRFAGLFPAGEHEARRRLEKFLKEKCPDYARDRSMLTGEPTSVLSPYFASGALSARTAVVMAKKDNKNQLDRNSQGHMHWISEVAWRDFYRHVLVHWPFVGMNKCFKTEATNIEWEYDEEQFQAWCDGKTGYPIVDAAMRQLKHSAWLSNRSRMVVASFLSKDLLIDWRRGERHFMEYLVDGDFSSNHGGWGFGASTGVDPQPYFRIFNPLRQSENFDPDGEYIREWLPELRDIKGKAIHDPYHRGAGPIAQKNGYPKQIVDHFASRDRALARYKAALQK
ncbi:Deoxyribodipyrimidine photo-lyase [Penicillium oxalicum]|uniref:Photolyase/cryptochrome alpha/beta domain-containing protein n=1 Tax=Penicillium oxalicum (strain 114-2 / CGMCC 5302) TaxID=933388 RepID=S8B4M5_PENO1|nr:Deoxyribodipyrimidine photo-lyase [Penicillium oxalicum]EPS29512.1 hypothetical protein PDE_04462 [Penicillium oxalicum 114-2]KAI2793406.1 Deoxyribodipyrimidine photo-lyase [Penicillium oxalicum]